MGVWRSGRTPLVPRRLSICVTVLSETKGQTEAGGLLGANLGSSRTGIQGCPRMSQVQDLRRRPRSGQGQGHSESLRGSPSLNYTSLASPSPAPESRGAEGRQDEKGYECLFQDASPGWPGREESLFQHSSVPWGWAFMTVRVHRLMTRCDSLAR